jgi:hypothetical protein
LIVGVVLQAGANGSGANVYETCRQSLRALDWNNAATFASDYLLNTVKQVIDAYSAASAQAHMGDPQSQQVWLWGEGDEMR